MHLHALDSRNLTRSGLALQALVRWLAANPSDNNPTIRNLADTAGTCMRTMIRGVAELIEYGQVVAVADPDSPVGRRLQLVAPPTQSGPVEAVDPLTEQSGPPPSDLAPPDNLGAPNESVPLRSNQTRRHEHVERRCDRSVRGGKDPRPVGDVLAATRSRIDNWMGEQIAVGVGNAHPGAQLARLDHLEHQERLPIAAGSRPSAGSPLKLWQAIRPLEQGDSRGVMPAVVAFKAAFDDDYEPVHRRVAWAVVTGKHPFASLIRSIEEATGPNVIHPGKAWVAAVKRNFPGLIRAQKTGPGDIRQDSPGPASEITDTLYSSPATA